MKNYFRINKLYFIIIKIIIFYIKFNEKNVIFYY